MRTGILSAGRIALQLAPEVGGSIARLDWLDGNGHIPILRALADGLDDPLEAACFPLVPFSNRIAGRTFRLGERTVHLQPNMAGESNVIHGQGWRHPWHVVALDATAAALAFVHSAGEWPWTYEARQDFALDDRGLSARISCRNLSEEPMPCGLGFHPYFPCLGEARLSTHAEGVWTIDQAILPVERVPVSGRYVLDGRPICGRGLDNGYDGWSGVAQIDPGEDAPFTLRLSSPDARYFQLYSPEEGQIFVAEPVSHANSALALPQEEWAALGIRILGPGETMAFHMRLDIIPRR